MSNEILGFVAMEQQYQEVQDEDKEIHIQKLFKWLGLEVPFKICSSAV